MALPSKELRTRGLAIEGTFGSGVMTKTDFGILTIEGPMRNILVFV